MCADTSFMWLVLFRMFRKVLTVSTLHSSWGWSASFLDLRVELSLSNAYSNADSAREACPNIVPLQTPPVKPSAAQSYFGKNVTKQLFRIFISGLRSDVCIFY